ncbi:hypothetical protein EDB81DRAFT_489222 [Dactylonectria macrodidyma]|uniref:Secreted protein n=1 Tax=Dactylonectria macrodidyma TaxID=307937 RepID=A0A9P9EWN3_9HYPO|nr:hypothetical protein EDB81DRAFT_489222 [Dactylonectria macrodidyma]
MEVPMPTYPAATSRCLLVTLFTVSNALNPFLGAPRLHPGFKRVRPPCLRWPAMTTTSTSSTSPFGCTSRILESTMSTTSTTVRKLQYVVLRNAYCPPRHETIPPASLLVKQGP